MTERELQAVSRLKAWLLEYGHVHGNVFSEDLQIVLGMARRPDVREILLSDEFMDAFMKKFLNHPLPQRTQELDLSFKPIDVIRRDEP